MINTDYDLAWEDIHLVLQEVEKSALLSEDRNQILAFTQGTLLAVNTILTAMETTAKQAQDQPWNLSADKSSVKMGFDANLYDLLAKLDDPNVDKATKYLQECLSCNLRANFGFQFKPLSLLDGFKQVLDQLNVALDKLIPRLEPNKMLEELCHMMNMLNDFCIQDLVLILMSFKLLLKQYLTNAINIRLDWTFLIAPLLKLIVSFVSSLVDAITAGVSGPIECINSAVLSIAQVAQNMIQLAGQVYEAGDELSKSIQNPSGDFKAGTTGTVGNKDNVPKGFFVRANMTLEDAMNDPAWAKAKPMQQLAVTVNSARMYLKNLKDKIKSTLSSLLSLTGGGFVFNLNLSGIILLIHDLGSLINMIINIRMSNTKPKDWCELFKQNPAILENVFKSINPNYSLDLVEVTGVTSFNLVHNNEIIANIPLCVSSRDTEMNDLLRQWLNEIEVRK